MMVKGKWDAHDGMVWVKLDGDGGVGNDHNKNGENHNNFDSWSQCFSKCPLCFMYTHVVMEILISKQTTTPS